MEKPIFGDKPSEITLSQAVLAPLDSIYQAQIHGARSFLNMLLQIGYPHLPINPQTGMPFENTDPQKYKPYQMEFNFMQKNANNDEKGYRIKIPALALVPLNSLAIENAEINFGLKVKTIDRFQQMQESENEAIKKENKVFDQTKRAWHLVKDPVSLKGEVSSTPNDNMRERSEDAIIDIHIKLGKTPIPAGLDKLLTSLTNSAYAEENNAI